MTDATEPAAPDGTGARAETVCAGCSAAGVRTRKRGFGEDERELCADCTACEDGLAGENLVRALAWASPDAEAEWRRGMADARAARRRPIAGGAPADGERREADGDAAAAPRARIAETRRRRLEERRAREEYEARGGGSMRGCAICLIGRAPLGERLRWFCERRRLDPGRADCRCGCGERFAAALAALEAGGELPPPWPGGGDPPADAPPREPADQLPPIAGGAPAGGDEAPAPETEKLWIVEILNPWQGRFDRYRTRQEGRDCGERDADLHRLERWWR